MWNQCRPGGCRFCTTWLCGCINDAAPMLAIQSRVAITLQRSWLESAYTHAHFFGLQDFDQKRRSYWPGFWCSLIGLWMQNYKSLCAALTICATQRQHFDLLISLAQPTEIKTTNTQLYINIWFINTQLMAFKHIQRCMKFTQFLTQMYLGSQMCWLDLGFKRSMIKVTLGNDPKNWANTISS